MPRTGCEVYNFKKAIFPLPRRLTAFFGMSMSIRRLRINASFSLEGQPFIMVDLTLSAPQ